MAMERVTQYLAKMRRMLYRRGRKREEIEDLMQDAFVCLLEYCKSGAEVREPEALLVRAVQRLAMNRDRDAHRDLYARQPVENFMLSDPKPFPEEALYLDQCLEQASSVLNALDPRTRDVFFLQRIHGYSYAQIAQQTGMPVSTIEKHIARAMTVLLEERHREKEGA